MATLCAPEERYVFRTGDIDQARQFLDFNGFDLQVAPSERNLLDLFIDSEDLQSTSVLYMRRGASADLTRTDRQSACGDYWIVLPLRETMGGAVCGNQISLGPEQGLVCSPGRPFTIHTTGRGANFNVGFPEHVMRRRLAALLGENAPGTLEFAPTIDLSNGLGNGLARHIRHLMGNFLDGRTIFQDAVMAASLEDAIACELLLQHPHNYSQRLGQLKGIATADMRRALEFIDANLDTAITIEDLAEATGVAGRTLFRHFRQTRGVSPQRYIRDLRFQKVRQLLLAASAESSVTDIALGCGFSHLGRFAADYRKRFGETPSETLRRKSPK